jgi:hypothetical protein
MRGLKRFFRLSWIGYLILFFLIPAAGSFGQSGNSPCQPSGTVKYKSASVPDGCEVKALIQGKEYDLTKVVNGRYSLSIPADDPSTLEKEGWAENDYITLKVVGYSGGTLFSAKSGNVPVDINLTTMGVLNLTTWGKIKALFK